MKNIDKFYRTADGSPPIIGNGSELLNNARRTNPVTSYHTESAVNGEIAIRYDRKRAWEASVNYLEREERSDDDVVTVEGRPILTEVPHSFAN